MAVDKKSDHVGNHGGRYVDQDGQTKQFTYIDHDVKTKAIGGLGSSSLFNRQWEYMESYILENIESNTYIDFLRDNNLEWGEFNFRQMSQLSKLLGIDLSIMGIDDPGDKYEPKVRSCKGGACKIKRK